MIKYKKITFYCFSWVLSLLLATSGLAQGLDVCGEKCCAKSKKTTHGDFLPKGPSRHGVTGLQLPLCDLHGDRMAKSTLSVPYENPDKGLPGCCHLEKAEKRIQGVTNPTKSTRADHLTVAVIHAVLSDADTLGSHRRQAIAGYAIHPRAAPVPLYLKNASFIC